MEAFTKIVKAVLGISGMNGLTPQSGQVVADQYRQSFEEHLGVLELFEDAPYIQIRDQLHMEFSPAYYPFQCWDFCPKHKYAKIFEHYPNPVVLVFIG